MKTVLIYITAFCFLSSCASEGLSLNGRELDKEENDNCENKSFTYFVDVLPIINSSCAISGCHLGTQQMDVPDLSSYQKVFNFRGQIGNRVGSRAMPPPDSGLALSDQEINAIVCWVKSGAPQ